MRIDDLNGVVCDPLRDRFRLSRDTAVNYMLFATRGSASSRLPPMPHSKPALRRPLA
jgi:hypothetical protein